MIPDPKNYVPTKPEPVFRSFKEINSCRKLTSEDFRAWRDSLPPSPVASIIRLIVRGAYDMMDRRIGIGNRIFSQFRSKLGLEPSDKTEADAMAAKTLDRLGDDYKLITDGCAKELPTFKKFVAHGLITEYSELVLIDSYFRIKKDEDSQFDKLDDVLSGIPIYDLFLKGVKGCGPKLSGMLLAELNPYRAPNISSFWRYLGIDVHEKTGRGRGTRIEQHEERWMAKREGENPDGSPKYVMSRVALRTYCARRKSRLVFVGMGSIMKANIRWRECTLEEYDATLPQFRRLKDIAAHTNKQKEKVPARKDVPQVCKVTCPYCAAYMNYKYRLSHSSNMYKPGKPAKPSKDGKPGKEGAPLAWKDTSDGHRSNAARRYMAKMFVADLWLAWRMLEGLPITEPYAVAVLGRRPHHEGSPLNSIYTGDVELLEDPYDDEDLDDENAA